MSDLFDRPYPDSPGYKEETTSRAAAEAIAPRVKATRGMVLDVYRSAWPAGLTADEAAARMGRSVLAIRPRVTELRRMASLMPCKKADGSNLTRRNDSGVSATVLVCRRQDSAT